jgi:hypothetical protein
MKHIKLFENFTGREFTNDELSEIRERVIRLSQPGFFDRSELPSYLQEVSNNDPKVEEYLFNWLRNNGVNFEGTDYENPHCFKKR